MDEKIIDQNNLEYTRLQKKILKERGFALDHYNPDYIQRRIAVRMRARNANSYNEYIRILDNDAQEYNRLFDALTINVSQFFRDPSVFEAVRTQLLPTLIREKKQSGDSTVRIWSAGCASGEEPYSIAILLKETLGVEMKNYLISLYATDIDHQCLFKARESVYSKESLVNLKKEYLDRYFTILPNEKYKLSDEIKNMVIFKYHHLLKDISFPALDIIFCRNLLIYFTQEMKEQILEMFYKSLTAHGYLIIGKSELLFFSKARYYFYPFNSLEHIFRKERRKGLVKDYTGGERRKKWWWGLEQPKEKRLGVTVLIVDDSAFMRLTLKNMLIRNGLEVIGEAENGSDAVEKYKKLKPNFILMDILMPVEDGLATVREIVQNDPQAKILMVSAIGQETVVQEALQLGAKAYLTKPVTPDKLVATINSIISETTQKR
jgi:chemotaxis protein methyltransferase CheR